MRCCGLAAPGTQTRSFKRGCSCTASLAAVAAARSDPDRAATLGGAAAAIRDTIAFRHVEFELVITDPFLERAESTAGEGRWHAAWEKGRALSADAAVAYALA